MRTNFEHCVKIILAKEGGYSNHAWDNGGATNFGITLNTLRAWRRNDKLTAIDVQKMTVLEAQKIYAAQYWKPIGAAYLPGGIDLCVFDFAVNSGIRRSAQYLQRALGVNADGHVGAITTHKAQNADAPAIINKICNARMGFLRRLEDWNKAGRGWTVRVEDIRAKSLAMVEGFTA